MIPQHLSDKPVSWLKKHFPNYFKPAFLTNTQPVKRPMPHNVGGKTFKPSGMLNSGEYTSICKYLSELKDVRCSVCWQCPVSKVYDKNNAEYKVTKGMTLEQVKQLVEGVRKINAAL